MFYNVLLGFSSILLLIILIVLIDSKIQDARARRRNELILAALKYQAKGQVNNISISRGDSTERMSLDEFEKQLQKQHQGIWFNSFLEPGIKFMKQTVVTQPPKKQPVFLNEKDINRLAEIHKCLDEMYMLHLKSPTLNITPKESPVHMHVGQGQLTRTEKSQ